MNKIFLSLAMWLISLSAMYAQGVGINTPTPDPSAALDITSTTQGVLVPRMTQADRDAIASPATGLMIYQTDNTPGFYHYDGVSWTSLAGGGGGGGAATHQVLATRTSALTLPVAPSSGTPTIVDFTCNNTLVSPTAGTFDGTTFTATTAGLYLVTASSSFSTTAASVGFLQLLVNGSVYSYGAQTFSGNLPTASVARATLSMIVPLGVGEEMKLQFLNANTLQTGSLNTDGTTKISIAKLN